MRTNKSTKTASSKRKTPKKETTVEMKITTVMPRKISASKRQKLKMFEKIVLSKATK